MKRITLEELKNELKDYVLSVFDEYIEEHGEGTDASFFVHWFETTYMEKHMADMALDHVTFRIFLRKVLTNFYTKKEVNKKLNDQKWFLLDFINESILTALPYKDADGNILITKPVEELIGRVLYDAQTGELFQFRDDAEGNITTYVLFGEDLRDNQIVFLENMPTLEDSIYYMKDGKLESFLASHEHAGLMSAEDKEKLDSINPDDYLKEVSIDGVNLPKENGVVDIPKATDTTLGVVKGGENVEIGADGSINVDIPVSIDEVVNLRSITTAPATANEGDCYYNEAETKIHYYIDGAWDAGAEPQKSKVYFFEDGATIHQYRSDGDKLIEIQDTPQIATNTTVGIVKGGENVNIGADGSINVSFQTIEDKIDEVEQTIQELPEPKEYDVATTTELGLVKASNENDTAEGIAADGNVLVDGNGKMRVRKFIERVENGNEKYMFSVNPDKTIEMLRDGVWKKEIESTISKERTIVSKTFDMQSAAYEGGYIGQFFTEDIEKYFTDGATLESEIKIIPQIIEPQTSVTCKENGLILNDDRTGYTKTETTTYYYVAIRIKDNADVVVYDSLEDDGVVRIESFTKDRLPLKIYAELDIKTTTTTTPAESCTAKGFKPVTTYSCEFSLQGLKQIVTTPIGGANIALCKNGLLIEGAEGEAYVKVLEDGTIEHTFGATQNTGQANVIEQVKVNDVALPIANKSVNVKIAQNGELIEPNAEGVIDIIATEETVTEWNESSNLNDYTQTGLYHFQGYRITPTDNLPIDTYGDNINIAFTLIVDRQEGSISETTHIPCVVSQTLFLGNRQGSETKIYVRNATTFLSDGTTTWESWKELVTSTYLGIASSMEDELLNDATEIGLYTGAIVNTSTNTFDVFKLEVINNYAISNQASQLTGSTIPNTVLQTMTVVSLDSTDKQYKRKGNSINDVYQWGEWEEATSTSTTKYKVCDVVILEHTTESSIQTKVVSWENFIENKDSYKYVDVKSKGAYPIGLIVDPQKKTFIYLRTMVIENAPVVDSSEDTFCDLLFNSLHDGLGNTKSLMRQTYIDKNIIANIRYTSSIFYNGSGGQLTQFIPSRDENVLLKNVFYDNNKGWQDFRDKIEELNTIIGDSEHYPTTYHQGNNVFYTYTSSLVKTTGPSSINYTFYAANNELNVPLHEQHNKTDRIVYGILMNDEE